METKNNNDAELIELLFQVSRSMKEKMSYDTKIAHLTLIQLFTLKFIKNSTQPVHMKDIAEYFSIEMPTATSLLNKLSKLNLVTRTTGKNDRRNVTIKLTANGEKLLSTAMDMHSKKIEKMLSYLSDGQKKNLLSILNTLSQKI